MKRTIRMIAVVAIVVFSILLATDAEGTASRSLLPFLEIGGVQ